jgi:arylsulfatase
VPQPPNIILIITDQQRFDTVGALGAPYARTPHLDRLAREGIAFTDCFVAGASCAPSRASLFSGSYPHTAGVMRNADPWRTCWVEDLARAGYHCVNVGKMHTYPFEAPMGFHERYVVENKDRYLEGRYFFDRWDVAFQANGLERPGRVQYRRLPDYAERLGAISWDLSGAP